jgi:hypothetical protein
MIKQIKQTLTRNLLNIPGWRTSRKIVVIESDDWGSIRMPSKEVYDELLEKGIRVDQNPYARYDSLATPDDLDALFNVLNSVKDKNGNPAVLTANAVLANPDFEKIKEREYNQYFYEPFIDTLKRNKSTEYSFMLWKQGMETGVFHPQFHGREHLNVKKWMNALQKEEKITRIAFDYGTFGLSPGVNSGIKGNYMGAFNSGLSQDIKEYNKLLQEGLNQFEKLFGYKSKSFIPTTYTWSPDIEPVLMSNGVKYLQGMVHQRIPLDDDTNFKYKKNNFTGYKSKVGLLYVTRNAYFEPSQNQSFDWVSDCLNRTKIAFRWRKPVIISMHRLNVIGAIDENNRTRNLKLLKELLTTIKTKWPEVEFMSSDELGDVISEN